jgi:hypothetical protein
MISGASSRFKRRAALQNSLSVVYRTGRIGNPFRIVSPFVLGGSGIRLKIVETAIRKMGTSLALSAGIRRNRKEYV